MSYEIIHNVVQLFYLREVFIPSDLKEQMVDALRFLLVDDDDINVLQQDKLNRQKGKHFIFIWGGLIQIILMMLSFHKFI